MTAPLEGVTVVSLEQAVAAPFASRQLADLGARVIKVERPDGGDFARHYDRAAGSISSYFAWLNRGKESLRLDLKESGDRRLLDRLIADADVFLYNLSPAALVRMKLDADALRATDRRLITCGISGYGRLGEYADRKAYDLLIQCEAGLVSITGTPEQPAKVGISIADISAGMYAYSAILTALYRRERTGVGTGIDVPMIAALGEWMTQPFLLARHRNAPTPRTGARHASISPYGPYKTRDGVVYLAVQNEREWHRLCRDVLGRPEWTQDPRFTDNSARVAHDAELLAAIEADFAELSVVEVTETLAAADIAFGVEREVIALDQHPALIGRLRPTIGPDGMIPLFAPPADLTDFDSEPGSIPKLGEHDVIIRAEYGLE
jgi:itaconate CoA-transferase